MTDNEILAEIERRCDNWRRCYTDIAPQSCSSIQKVIDALSKKQGKAEDEENPDDETAERVEKPEPKDCRDAEALEFVWVNLATENDRTYWQEKAIIRCGVFLRSLPVRKLCQICKIKRHRDWPELYRKAMLFFAMRVRVYDCAKSNFSQND